MDRRHATGLHLETQQTSQQHNPALSKSRDSKTQLPCYFHLRILLYRLSMGAEIPVRPLCHTPRMPRRKGDAWFWGCQNYPTCTAPTTTTPPEPQNLKTLLLKQQTQSCQRHDTSERDVDTSSPWQMARSSTRSLEPATRYQRTRSISHSYYSRQSTGHTSRLFGKSREAHHDVSAYAQVKMSYAFLLLELPETNAQQFGSGSLETVVRKVGITSMTQCFRWNTQPLLQDCCLK